MLNGTLDPDPIDQNQKIVEGIKTRLRSLDDQIPFLLLPVRIETRFVRAERPVAATLTSASLKRRVGGLVGELRNFAALDLGAPQGRAKKRVHTSVDAQFAEVEARIGAVEEVLDRVTDADAADVRSITRLVRDLVTTSQRARANLGNLASEYMKSRFIERWTALETQRLEPTRRAIEQRVVQRLKLRRRLSVVAASDVRAEIEAARRVLSKLNQKAPTGPWRERRPRPGVARADAEQVLGQLQKLDGTLKHAIRAGMEERAALAADWALLDDELTGWLERVEDPTVRAAVSSIRAGVSAVGDTSPRRRRVVRTSDLDRSAVAYADLVKELRRVTQALKRPQGSHAFEGAIQAVAEFRKSAEKMSSLARQLVALPLESRRTLDLALKRVRKSMEQSLEVLGRGTANRPFREQEVRILSSRTQRVMRELEMSFDALSATGEAGKETAPLVFVSPTPTAVRPELWVRIFPDELAVQTHEPALTESEIEHGRRFLRDHTAAGSDDAKKRAAWATLCAHHRPHRAAWIAHRLTREIDPATGSSAELVAARQVKALIGHVSKMVGELATRPAKDGVWAEAWARRAAQALDRAQAKTKQTKRISESDRDVIADQLAVLQAQLASQRARFVAAAASGGAERLERAMHELVAKMTECRAALSGIDVLPDDALLAHVVPAAPLPPKEQKDDAWTSAPEVRTLPKRFVVIAIRDEKAVHVVAGKDVPATITVGLGPGNGSTGGASFSLDGDGNLEADPALAWLTDYDVAVQQGMAVTIPITEEDAVRGFDRLLVVGVRETTAGADRQALEELLEGHRYTASGLELLPLGTPTNNTESAASGYSLADRRDASARYDLEYGDLQYSATDSANAGATELSDGFRLATALGIDPAAFSRVGNAGMRQISDAITVNRLLWPATVGHYLDEMLAPIVSKNGARHVERFFSNDVLARGSQPSLRVGMQPYAVLPTMAFRSYRAVRQWKFPPPEAGEPHADAILAEVLGRLQRDWLELAKTNVKRAGNWDGAAPKQHFLDMMAVHPTASELHFRFAMNSAPHLPLTSEAREEAGALLVVTYHNLLARFRFLLEQAYVKLADASGATLDKVQRWAKITEMAQAANAYDVRYLAKQSPITGATMPGALSLSVDQIGPLVDSLVASNPNTLVAATLDPTAQSPLFAILLRHSVLCAYREAAMDVWEIDGALGSGERLASGSSTHFSVPSLGSAGRYLTKWSYLLCTPAELAELAGGGFATGTSLTASLGASSLANDLSGFAATTSLPASFGPALDRLAAYKEQLVGLKRIGDIDQLFREHLDLCSYRLDAWRTGLATRRLREQRARSAARGVQRPGVYLGAYGWVEDLRPDREVPAFATSVPVGLTHLGEDPVYVDPRTEGLLYAPSVNHAVAAAVLRSGYLSSTEKPDVDNERAVNLSSRRVRTARWLLTGIRNGNTLGALLGYRLERGMHEAYDSATGVELDQYIFKLRRSFPTAAAIDPTASTDEERQRQVVDGLAVLERVREHVVVATDTPTIYDAMRARDYEGFPWGLESEDGELLIPRKADTAALAAFAAEIDAVADALDAVADLLLAEGVYQVARGNLDRAAAVTTAMAEGKNPPDPQIVNTPRTGTRVTHRLLYAAAPLDGKLLSRVEVPGDALRTANQNAARPLGWTGAPLTPRACIEPTLNRWLASFLGASDTIGAYLIDERDENAPARQVRLTDLGIQPLDLVVWFGTGFEKAASRLSGLALLWAKRSGAITAADAARFRVVVSDRDAAWPTSVRSLREVAPLCEALYRSISGARPASAADFGLQEHRGDPEAGTEAVPDLAELVARVTEGTSQLADFVTAVAAAASALPDPAKPDLDELGAATVAFLGDEGAILAAREDIETLIARAWSLGIDASMPSPALDPRAAHTALADQLRVLYRTGTDRLRSARQSLAAAASVADLEACAKELLGGQATILPHFTLTNLDALRGQLDAPPTAGILRALGPDALDDWLHTAGRVRERAAALERTAILVDAFDQPVPALRPVQLPYVKGDYWLGAEFPSGYEPTGDKLSLVLVDDPTFLGAGDKVRAGLVLDEWTEVIPAASETTGVAFHYDAPDASPPQCLLLVVTPVESGKWYWEDLVHALDETLDLAMVRMVEPDHLQDAFYGHLLPALSGEVLPEDLNNNYGDRPSLNFAAAQGGT